MKTRKLRHKMGTRYNETGVPNQCQCSIACNRPALPKKAFCASHESQCPRESPMTGSEPDYHPSLWNKRMEFRKTHNCFSYSMNVLDKKQLAKCKSKKDCSVPFHQPGSAAGYEGFTDSKPKTCPNLMARIFGDNPNIELSDFTSQCPQGSSKIALIIDESDDYHFLRQDSNGYWSHKPGSMPVKNTDAYGHRIWDPKLANYNYVKADDGSLNYDIFCSYMCVPRNQALYLKVGGRR